MKKNIIKLMIAAILISPMLSSCSNKKLEEENAGLKQEVQTLTSEKASLETQIKDLTVKAEESAKANEELKAELEKVKAAKAAPAVKKGHKR